jgi:hypothetical protein
VPNTEVQMTLEDAVQEVLGLLTGLDLVYDSTLDRFRSITRQLNRALRANALEKEWSWYHTLLSLGTPVLNANHLYFPDAQKRARIINDDAVRFVDDDGYIQQWAYFLPRDALHKYQNRSGLWCSYTPGGQDAQSQPSDLPVLRFNRPFNEYDITLEARCPVQREPTMFVLPATPEDPNTPTAAVDPAELAQLVDFEYPDVVILRAAMYYASTDPVMQPRVQTLESQYKDLMYQIIEREDRNTDTPFQNEFFVPVQNGIDPESRWRPWPLSDNRR